MALVPFQLALVPLSFLERLRPSGLAPLKLKVEAWLGVSQYMHKKTNLWKLELNWSSKLRDINERKNTLVTRSCVHSDAWFRDLKFYTWGSQNQIRWKLLFSCKLHHFRESRSSQCFIQSTSPHYLLPIKVLCS